MASGPKDRRFNTHRSSTGGGESERAYRLRKDDRSPTSTSHSGERDIREAGRQDRRSRSPSRHESYRHRWNQPELVSHKDRERESRAREAEAYKISLRARSEEESGSPQRQKRAGSGSFDHTNHSETRQGQNPRPMPNVDEADGKANHQSTPADLPINEPETGDTVSDPQSELKEALTLFLSKASEQASLQLRKDAAKKMLDRRTAEYKKCQNIYEEYPPAAEALGAAKERSQQEFDKLDEELMRKRQESMYLVGLVTDCVFSKSTAPVQPHVPKEVKQADELYRTSLKTVEKQLEATRTTVQTELASIKHDVSGYIAQVATLAADIEQLKSGNGVGFKDKIDALSSRLESLPDFNIALSDETARINVALNAQSKDIKTLLTTNRVGNSEFEILKSTVTSLTKSDKEVKNSITKIQADLKGKDKAAGTTMDRRASDIDMKVGEVQMKVTALESARINTTLALQKVQLFDGRIKMIENSLPAPKDLETMDTRLEKLESDSFENTVIKKELEEVSKRVQRLESDQEKVEIVREGLVNVERLIHRRTQSLNDIDKRLKGVEGDYFNETLTTKKLEELESKLNAIGDNQSNDERKQEMINKSTQGVDGKLIISAEQDNVPGFTEKLLKMQNDLREEFKKTQDAGDEMLDKYLQNVDGRIKAIQDDNLGDRITALEVEGKERNQAVIEQKKALDRIEPLEDRITALEVEGRERNQAVIEQKKALDRIEPLETAYAAFDSHTRVEMTRISSDLEKLTEETKQMASARSSSTPPHVAQEIGRISNDIQTLKDNAGRLNTCAATIGPLANRIQNTEEKINILINDIEGLKVATNSLDFRMCNLTTKDLAKQILDQLDAHRQNGETNITALSLRVRELDKAVNKNEVEKRAELARISRVLQQELAQLITSSINEKSETLNSINDPTKEVLDSSLKGSDAVQHEVDKSNTSLSSLREDVDTTKKALTEARDRLDVEISNLKNSLIAAQKEIVGAKVEFTDGLATLKGEMNGFSAQLQIQAESRVPEKRKLETNVTPKKANGHGQGFKKRKVSARRDHSGDSDSDYRV